MYAICADGWVDEWIGAVGDRCLGSRMLGWDSGTRYGGARFLGEFVVRVEAGAKGRAWNAVQTICSLVSLSMVVRCTCLSSRDPELSGLGVER